MSDAKQSILGAYKPGSRNTSTSQTTPVLRDEGGSVTIGVDLRGTPGGASVSIAIVEDMAGAFTPVTAVTAPPGQEFVLAPVKLEPGLHNLVALATKADGSVVTSNPLTILQLMPSAAGTVDTTYSSVDLAKFFPLATGLASFIVSAKTIHLADGMITLGGTGSDARLARLYQGLFGRSYDAGGLGFYAARLATGVPLTTLVTQMLASAEYAAKAPQTNEQFIDACYQGFLRRVPDTAGRESYLSALASGTSRAAVVVAMLDSRESNAVLFAPVAILNRDATATQVDEVYRTGLARSPDASGLQSYTTLLSSGRTSEFVAAIAGSPEFRALHGTQSNSAFVTSLYTAGLNRAPDGPGLQSYVDRLASGAATRADVLLDIALSPEANARLPSIL